MRIAIIDLGTNSVRFDVHELGPERIKTLYREKLMVRLGQGVFIHGQLDRSAELRTLSAFRHFASVSKQLKVQKVVAFATSALREARDAEDFVAQVQKKTGLNLKIISGPEEAKFIAHGVLENENIRSDKFALVDIGGGSTEVSICKKYEVAHAESFRLGTARLQQVFLKRSPPKPANLLEMRSFIRNSVNHKVLSEGWPEVPLVVGSSGTVRALVKILKKKKKSVKKNGIQFEDLREINNQMSLMNTSQLLGMEGMEPKRVDMILAGSILLEEIMFTLGAKRVVPTDYSLRDGILLEERKLLREKRTSRMEFHLDDLYEIAKRFGADLKHCQRMVAIGEKLFDRLERVHKIPPMWRIYLTATVILRNLGDIISLSRHAKHTNYIIKNGDFPSMQAWENDFIAELCQFHSGGKIERGKLKFGKDKKKFDIFVKLVALLRVIDALDLGPRSKVDIKRISWDKNQVRIFGKFPAGIESLMLERKKEMFENVFGRKLIIH